MGGYDGSGGNGWRPGGVNGGGAAPVVPGAPAPPDPVTLTASGPAVDGWHNEGVPGDFLASAGAASWGSGDGDSLVAARKRARMTMPSAKGVRPRPAGDTTPQWPIHVDWYDPAADKRWSGKFLAGSIAVAVVFGVLTALTVRTIITMWLSGILGTIAIVALFIVIGELVTIIRKSKVPEQPGLLITGKAILDAYGRHGVREIALSTPIAGESVDEDYILKLVRNDVHGLWFQPTATTHSYMLYWRDEDYARIDEDRLLGKSVEQPGYERPTSSALRSSQRYLRAWHEKHGVDLRMWPCVLEVNGSHARLMFSPDAVKTSQGLQDPKIRPGIDDVMMLADTF